MNEVQRISSEEDLAHLIDRAIWETTEGDDRELFESVQEIRETGTIADSQWLTSNVGLEVTMEDGTVYLVSVQKVR